MDRRLSGSDTDTIAYVAERNVAGVRYRDDGLARGFQNEYLAAMHLKDWLDETSTSLRTFARRIGVANASVVQKYAGGRVPRSAKVRDAIVRETDGKVQLADLYAAAAE